MRIRNTDTVYGSIAQLLHWLIAALILNQFVLARMADGASLVQQLGIMARHKSFGMTVFALAILRLAWRHTNPLPPPPPGQPRHQQLIARTSHYLMYALLFMLPVTGWSTSSAANFPVSYFGLFTLPDLLAPNESWVEPLRLTHELLFNALAAIVALHTGAALFHHFIVKDGVLKRMIPGLGGDHSA